jgi:transposase-like protein
MARKYRDRGLAERWRRRIRQQQATGMSIRAYCLRHGLHESAFYFWRRTLAERDRHAEPAFVPVRVIDAPATSSSSPIDIYLAGGRRVRVRAGCDRELLAALVELLEGRPC